MMNSKRSFLVIGVDTGIPFEMLVWLNEIPKEQTLEVMFTIQDEIDAILDLKVGESMYFQVTRDNANDKGVIVRKS